MKLYKLFIFFIAYWPLKAQTFFEGKVIAKENTETIAISGANVYWKDTKIGAISDSNGDFKLEIVPNNNNLIISYLGYKTDTLSVDLSKRLIHFLKEDPEAALAEVTVTQKQRTLQKSVYQAQNIITVNKDELLKAACCNLSESFDTNPSIDVNFSDALTGTKQIRMLGLTSPYILFAEENIPSVRGAAQAYGLTFTPGTWIESIQITKGAGSVVNGFESIAGQINTELIKPFAAQPLFLNLYASANGRVEGNIHFTAAAGKKWHTGLFIHANQRNQKVDRNNDGFLDMPIAEQLNLLNRWQYTDAERGWVGFFNFRLMEDRKQLGQVEFNPTASTDGIWGSELSTQRWEGAMKIGKVNPILTYRSWGLQAALSYHQQESYFGLRIYDINHTSSYINLLYNSIIGNTNTTVKSGINFSFDTYEEQVDDENWLRTDQGIGGFTEISQTSEKINWTLGMRIDIHNNLGTFFTPRIHLRYTPFETSIFRASAGQGRKAANVFAEQQQQFGTNRSIQIRNTDGVFYGLEAEKAWNYGFSWRQIILRGPKQADITFDYYTTDFDNQVVVDWETPGAIKFYNLEGESYAKSFQVAVDYSPSAQWDIRLAYKNYQVKSQYDSGFKQMPLQPKNRFFVNVGWESKITPNGHQWRWDATWHGVGSQRLVASPRDGQGRWAPAYNLINSQLSRAFSADFELYLGGENIGDYRQVNAIISAEQPFGPLFDSAQIYAPIFGQMTYVGLRWNL